MTEPIVTLEHVRQAGFCLRGVRPWAERHGLDFRDFLINGIAVSRLANLNDAFADRMIKIALAEQPKD